jgi:hypothetical protein
MGSNPFGCATFAGARHDAREPPITRDASHVVESYLADREGALVSS